MKRKTFDSIVTIVGAGLTIFFIVAGSLGLWAYSFANSNVHNQLAEQQITFPPAAAFTHAVVGTEITPSMVPSVSQYAGQQLVSGKQAQTYADNFIAVHLQEIGGGKSYAQLSSEAMALPKGSPQYVAAEAKVTTVFQGTTLRGLLLEGYAFWQMGQIALFAAFACFALAVVMLLFTALGFVHMRRTPADVEI
jgi:ABC-type transport system involved in multi-copper enzyme maturation permease subunit